MNGILTRRGNLDTDMHGVRQCEDTQGENGHMKTEILEFFSLKLRKALGYQKLEVAEKDPSLQREHGPADTC